METVERITKWSLDEVNSFWGELHGKAKLSKTDFNDEPALLFLYTNAQVIADDPALKMFTVAFINDFDVAKANDSIQKVKAKTELAEQLHYYFLDKPEQLEGFLATVSTIGAIFGDESEARDFLSEILDGIKGE